MTRADVTLEQDLDVDDSDLTIRQVQGLFAVYRGNNERVSDRLAERIHAVRAMDALLKKEKSKIGKERKCLCCQQAFPSEGPHNRMCASCRIVSLDAQMAG